MKRLSPRRCATAGARFVFVPAGARLALVTVACIALCVLASLDARGDTEITLKTKIVSVTVYSERAQVTRRGTIELGKGAHRIVCDDLPNGFVESSLQVEGSGTAGATIVGIDFTKRHGVVSELPRYRELKEEIAALEERKDSLTILLDAARKRIKFIESLDELPLKEANEKLAGEIFRVDEWRALMDFLDAERVKTNLVIRRLKGAIEELAKEIDWIKGDLNEIRADEEWGKRVIIDCDITAAGRLTLDLAYVINGARWEPEYTIRHRTGENEIELTYNARITQATGEGWNDVSVLLSTAAPHVGAAPPNLYAHYLGKRPPELGQATIEESRQMGLVVQVGDELHVRGGRSGETPVVKLEAGTSATAFAANFTLPKPVDLPSGSTPKRVLITNKSLPVELSRYAVPILEPHVFVRGELTNTLAVPLLGGQAEVYIETKPGEGAGRVTNFVGREEILSTATGQSFFLHLGVDQDIKVTRTLERKEYLSKTGKSDTKIRFSYIVTIENFKKQDVEVNLKDRVPVSAMKEIKVNDIDLDPEPAEKGDDGIITWKLPVGPGATQRVRIAYTVIFPSNLPIQYFDIGK